MTDAFLLGAGFSMALDHLNMPSTDELGAQAIELLRSVHETGARTHSEICDGLSCDHPMLVEGKPPGGNFEVWLSRLAEPQPYRFEHEIAIAASLYQQLANAVGDVILWATERACEQTVPTEPPWFEPLLREWHDRRADVVTFNYDTLVEARYDALEMTEDGARLEYCHLNGLLPAAGDIDGGSAGPPPTSFRYMKLHGSIHWYWDPMTRSADSMADVGLPAKWRLSSEGEAWHPEDLVPGRRPVIVPPTTSKTAFFNNPVIRHQWRQAFEAMRRARRVVLIGYSLPIYDVLVGSLLDDAARQGKSIKATVVDVDPGPVEQRLVSLGYAVTRSFDNIGDFVSHYRSGADA